ncbi:MAG: sigma-70 family RNA polymerase sigma factor [Saprospiraceae bacterium]
MTSQEDINWINSTLQGDVRAFEKIVQKYSDMVFTIALRIVGHREEAEEIAQDVFINIYKSLHVFQHKAKFSTWVYRIAYNASINCTRKAKKVIELVEWNESVHTDYISTSNEEDNDERKIILDSIETLDEIDQIIVTLYYYDNTPVKEIATITQLSESNIKSRLLRSRTKLQKVLSKNWQNMPME